MDRTTDDARPASTALLTACALVLIAGGIAAAFWMEHPHYYRRWDLVDLEVYRAAGKAVLHRHSVFGDYVRANLRVPLPFIYPPAAAILAAPFALLSETPANLLWTAITVVLLALVVRVCFAPLIERFGRGRLVAWLLLVLVAASLTPVQDHLRFGQVGIPLMACCIFDCTTEKPRWPRGLLIGVATAFKLVPGIFIPYLFLTRRVRAGWTAVGTFVGLSLAGLVIAPSDSWSFWTDKMFQPTSPTFFSNQSLEGIFERAIGPWRVLWLPCVIAIVGFGMWRAAIAALGGDELRGVAITGMVGVLVSPISWIHHLVWVIPVLAVIVGRGTDRKRVAIAFFAAAFFIARVPYIGHDELHGHGFLAALLQDGYGLGCLALFLYLTDAIPLAREALARRSGGSAATRSRATTPGHPR